MKSKVASARIPIDKFEEFASLSKQEGFSSLSDHLKHLIYQKLDSADEGLVSIESEPKSVSKPAPKPETHKPLTQEEKFKQDYEFGRKGIRHTLGLDKVAKPTIGLPTQKRNIDDIKFSQMKKICQAIDNLNPLTPDDIIDIRNSNEDSSSLAEKYDRPVEEIKKFQNRKGSWGKMEDNGFFPQLQKHWKYIYTTVKSTEKIDSVKEREEAAVAKGRRSLLNQHSRVRRASNSPSDTLSIPTVPIG